jgi:hypothetical protein
MLPDVGNETSGLLRPLRRTPNANENAFDHLGAESVQCGAEPKSLKRETVETKAARSKALRSQSSVPRAGKYDVALVKCAHLAAFGCRD